MKRINFALTLLFSLAVIQTQAQVSQERAQINKTKKELKTERETLRKLEGTKVSELAKTHFNTDFGKVSDPVWKRVGSYDEVSYMKNGKKMESFYDYNANLVGTSRNIKFADLPAKGQKEIKTKYKDYKVGQAIFFDDNEVNETDMILYGVQFDDEDKYFVELTKGTEKIVVNVTPAGFVSYFKKL